MPRRRANLRPETQEVYDLLSRAATKSDAVDLAGVLADCAAVVAHAYGSPDSPTWAKPLELKVVARGLDGIPATERDVYLCEVEGGGRQTLLYHTGCKPAQWQVLIEFAKAFDAKIVGEPIGAQSITFVHPALLPKGKRT